MVDEKIKLLPRWTSIANFINLIGKGTCDIFIYFNNIKCPFPKYGVRKTNEIEGKTHVRYTSHIDDENKVTSYLKGL